MSYISLLALVSNNNWIYDLYLGLVKSGMGAGWGEAVGMEMWS